MTKPNISKAVKAPSFSALIALLLFTQTGWAGPLDTWTLRNPEPTGNDLHGFVYGDSQFVAVGAGGAILTSVDAVNWVLRPSPTVSALSGIAYGNGQFVAVGDAGTIVTSGDGVTWVPRASGSALPLLAITFGKGQYVAVGGGYNPATSQWESTIVTSSDGISWDRGEPPSADGSAGILGVAYGNGLFVAVGNLATTTGTYSLHSSIITSTDGTNWVPQQVLSTDGSLGSIAYGKGQFVAASRPDGRNTYLLTSPDGSNWTQHWPFIANLFGLAYGNGQFVGTVVCDPATSADGVNWVERPSGIPWDDHYTAELYASAYGNGQFVVVGEGGTIVSSSGGVNWVRREPKELIVLSDITYGNGQFVAVGDWYNTATSGWEAISQTSADGVAWNTSHVGPGSSFNKIACGADRFVATGYWSNALSGWAGTILTSSNGVNWIPVNPRPTHVLSAIAYGNGQFVAEGADVQAVSTNGVDWVELPSGGYAVLANGNGRFVGLAEYGHGPSFNAMAYGSGQFVSVGYYWDSGAVIQSSLEGVNWIWRDPGTPYGASLEGIAYGANCFVAVGGEGKYFLGGVGDVQGALIVVTSADGMSWARRSVPGMQLTPSAIAYGNGHFVAVGPRGAILQSGNIITLAIAPKANTGPLSLPLEGPSGLHYTIETSTDLNSWRTLTNITNTQPITISLDPLPAKADSAYFRAYSQ